MEGNETPIHSQANHFDCQHSLTGTLQELHDTFQKAVERPSRGGTLGVVDDHAESWMDRHQVVFSNDKLNPNYRSYFDRWLDSRHFRQADEKAGPVKPSWRLNPEALSVSERQREKSMMASWSPSGKSTRGGSTGSKSVPSSKEMVTNRRAARLSREKSWETTGLHFWELPEHLARVESSESGGKTLELPQAQAGGETRPATASSIVGANEKHNARQWESHHHITWCNFRNVGGTIPNPATTRCYFDRHREPDIGARSAAKPPAVPDGAEKGRAPKRQILKAYPVWRLEPVPGGMMPEVGVPCDIEPALKARTGHGGFPKPRSQILGPKHEASKEFNHKATWSSPTPSTENLHDALHGEDWNIRHHLVFKNEEVSRLDRCYFDRWREPEALRKPGDEGPAPCSVWTLDGGTTDKLQDDFTEEEEIRHFELRNTSNVAWCSRHHLLFDNNIHMNLRSYFGRFRAVPSTDGLVLADYADIRPQGFADLTESAENRCRHKLTDSEKLRVDWTLKGKPSREEKEFDAVQTLRRCDTDPGSKESLLKSKRRAGWFSSHDVIF